MTPNQDAVISKIQKLLALANSANEAEAALAMARAQELLAKYNLDFAQVQDSVAVNEKREKTLIDRTAKFKWQVTLWRALAESNYCWYWTQDVFVGSPEPWRCLDCFDIKGKCASSWTDCSVCGREDVSCYRRQRRTVKRHMILGSMSNVSAVRLMGEYLEDTMTRLCPYTGGGLFAGAMAAARNMWRTGCTDRLAERIREKFEDLKRASAAANQGDGTSLMTLTDVAHQEYIKNYDACYGAGAWQKKIEAEAEWQRKQAEREKKAEEERIQAEKEWLEYLQNETPEQKAAREIQEEKQRLKEEREWRRRSRRYSYSSYRESRKKDIDNTSDEAYRAGFSQAESIGLDSQINSPSVAERKKLA